MRRLCPALTGLVLSAGLLVTTAAAQAAPIASGTARALHAPAAAMSAARSAAPSAARIAARDANRLASTVSPTISPAAFSVTHLPASRPSYSCPSSELCLQVYDPVTEGTIIFALYYCKTYTLFNWNGAGTYRDNQTGGVESDFIVPPDTDILPDSGILHSTNWTPYNQINSC